jgi:hypothetical protein
VTKKKEEEDDDDDVLPRVMKAEITDDGALVVKFDQYVSKGKKEVVFMPEALLAIAQEYGVQDTDGDFVGLLHVYEEEIFGDEDEEEEEEADGEGEEVPAEEPTEVPEGVPEDIFDLDGDAEGKTPDPDELGEGKK